MNSEQLSKLKGALKDEKELILEQLGHIAKKNPDVEGDWKAVFKKVDSSVPMDEQAQSVTNWEQRRAIEQNLEIRLKEINAALIKIEGGSYGVCNGCDKEIGQQRLAAIPVTALCRKCMENDQIRSV